MRVGTGVAGVGLGGIVILLIGMFLGVDPSVILNNVNVDPGSSEPAAAPPADDETAQFVSVVLGFTEDAWTEAFRASGREYRPPRLVLFSGAVQSACGFGQSAMGPFYCPGDERVYLDTSFFQELHQRFQAPGDFAQAYVIAHEVGHHVQNLLNITDQVEQARRNSSKAEANDASVRLELQADCFAGVWANRTERTAQSQLKEFLDAGDFEEALNAASAIGDDKLQMQSQGYVVPESFTHGSAQQRMSWFRKGFDTGQPDACNTFN
jgi:predicted metalloprotease